MCGLVGIVGANLITTHLDAFSMMLHLDVTRGKDSTGVAFRKTNTKTNRVDISLLKVEGLPYNLYRKFPEVWDAKGAMVSKVGERYDWVMGHNRAATVGAINSSNAHPFHHGSIVGCHNGTISGGLHSLPSSPKLPPNCTDSERIMYALSQGWTVQKVMDTLTGAAALTWWDSDTQTYNLYRNKDRTLCYAMNPAKTILAYASEPWILRVAMANTRNIEFVKEIIEIPENQHIVLHMDKGAIKEMATHEIKVKTATPVVTSHVVNYAVNNVTKLRNHKVPSYLNTAGKRDQTFRSSSGWLDLSVMSKEEFSNKARFGCSLCGCDLDFDEHQKGEVRWAEKDTPLCFACSDEFKLAN